MTGHQCATSCGRPTRDGLALCEQCLWELRRSLGDVPALVAELEVTMSREAVMAESAGKINGDAETPMPYDLQAADRLSDLRVYLVGWVRDLAGDDPAKYPADDLTSMSRWLLARINDLAVHPAAGDIHAEIVGTVRDAWRVVDKAANRTRFAVGPCPEVDCPGEVVAYIPTSEDHAARLECAGCGSRWETHQWMKVGKRILAKSGSWTPRSRLSRSA